MTDEFRDLLADTEFYQMEPEPAPAHFRETCRKDYGQGNSQKNSDTASTSLIQKHSST